MPRVVRSLFLFFAAHLAIVGCTGESAETHSGPVAAAPLVCCPPTAEDWPQYRGLDRQGATEASIAPWGDDGPTELWRRPIGAGFASMSMVGDRLFTAADADGAEVLLALDAATGDELWRAELGPTFREEYGDGPRSTPTVDDRGMVYGLSSRAVLTALDSRDGSTIWRRDLYDTFGGGKGYDRGYASSPLIDGERLILTVGPGDGGAVVALERTTGDILWSSQDGVAAYSSPIAVAIDGHPQIVTPIGRGLIGLDPADGSLLWEVDWPTRYGLNIAMPVRLSENRFLLSSGYDQGAMVVEVRRSGDAWSAETVWTERLFRNHFATSVHHDGLIFGFDNARLKCLDATDGSTRWATGDYGKGSLIRAGETLIVVSDDGDVALVEATGDGFRELVRSRVLDGKTWTAPALAHGRLVVRSDREIVSLDLAAPTS